MPEGENMQRARFGLTFHIFRGIWCIVCNTTLILQKPLFGKKPQKHFYPTNYLEQQLKNSNILRSEIPHLFFKKCKVHTYHIRHVKKFRNITE